MLKASSKASQQYAICVLKKKTQSGNKWKILTKLKLNNQQQQTVSIMNDVEVCFILNLIKHYKERSL